MKVDWWYFKGFPNLCSCCSINKNRIQSAAAHDTICSQSSDVSSLSLPSQTSSSSDARSSSVNELRRKAQEHSAALLHSLHAVAVSGLYFPPISLHHALTSNRAKGGHHFSADYLSEFSAAAAHHHNNNNNSNNNNNMLSKLEPNEKSECLSDKAISNN